MLDDPSQMPAADPKEAAQTFNRRRLSYATTFTNPVAGTIIRVMEWFTGKVTVLRWIRKFERSDYPTDHTYWRAAMETMGITVTTPDAQLANIPAEGPVIVVSNHPHGMVDGMIMGELIGRRRPDYKVLTRSLLVNVDEVATNYLIPVPFPHEEDAQRKSVEMRAAAMAHLKDGGVICLFPSGVVSSSKTFFGPAIEGDWSPFTAKMIQRSGATIVPIKFHGQNSRAYQIANKISPVLRQGLLLHEIVAQGNSTQSPTIGAPIGREVVDGWAKDPRGFMAWLRETVLALPKNS